MEKESKLNNNTDLIVYNGPFNCKYNFINEW